jgi:uncharacterized protein YndB with AHSA1/START domain
MQVNIQSTNPVTDAAAKKDTGRTLKEWFAFLDANDGLAKGRRNCVMLLYGEMGKQEWWATTVAVEYERAKGQLKKDGLLEGYGICSTKTINAPPATVYAAWAEDKSFAKWFAGGLKAKVADSGTYEDSDGNRGKFLRVRENKDLRFSWENPAFSGPSLVDVAFDAKGTDRTLLVLNHSRIQTRAEADGLREAWGQALDRLKQQVEG